MNNSYRLVLLLIVFLFACSKAEKKHFDADSLHLFYTNGDTIIEFVEKRREVIDAFAEVLDSPQVNTKCHNNGELRFMKNNQITYFVGFSISTDCQYLTHNDTAWKLNYRAGMYLSELRDSLLTKR